MSLSSAAALAAEIDISAIVNDIESSGSRLNRQDTSLGASLDRDSAALTEIMKDKKLSAADVLILRYYRAFAWLARNEFNAATHRGAYDLELARNSVSEMEDVAAGIGQMTGEDAQRLGLFKSNALYFAGTGALNQLNEQDRAYRNWTACAALGHPGCLNIIALARITGDGGTPIDANESLRMHKRVFDTATNAGCAGVSSAYSIAVMVALGVVKNSGENAEVWIENASNLLNVLEADEPGNERCSRPSIQLARYMIALSHGKKNPVLLADLVDGHSGKFYGDIARYVLGDFDSRSLEQNVAGLSDGARCTAAFYGLWSADLARKKEDAQTFQSMMAAGSTDVGCRVEIAYTKRLKVLQ